jgi:hypothetical protein
MKHVRGDLIALLVVAALALAGQREAMACKADGQTCRTSRSCCGTSGNNGVCVGGGTKVGFGVCCTPNCTDKECGDDGCGGTCGTCSTLATCQSGTCISACMFICHDVNFPCMAAFAHQTDCPSECLGVCNEACGFIGCTVAECIAECP